MPLAIPKRCGFRGCPKITRGRYCDEHQPLARQYYDGRRGSSTERGYVSEP
jgi:5-methylcytosine-specific restriction enzyme A